MPIPPSDRKLPWLSATLLLLTYANFGWVLADSESPGWIWALGAALTVLLAEALASPWSLIRNVLFRWLRSDSRAFLTAMTGAFFAVILIVWIEISAHGILLVTAAALVRLDAQRLDVKDWQAFLLLMLVSAMGIALGGLWHRWL